MENQSPCSCGKVSYKVVFACSGASDVGAISDQAARTLVHDQAAVMSCTAGVAARVPAIMEKAQNASGILALDGCDKQCVSTVLESAGFNDFGRLNLTDLGLEKGKSPVTQARVQQAAEAARNSFGTLERK
jgi:uncharacterized metal-binding protein